MAELARGAVRLWFRWVMEFGPLLMDSRESCAQLFGTDLGLTEEEYNALYLLAQRPGETLSVDVLYAAAWEPPDGIARRSVARAGMENIRRKLDAHGRGVVYLRRSVQGGYTFHCNPTTACIAKGEAL